jgi:hypothetical protein
LAHIGANHIVWLHRPHQLQQFFFVSTFEFCFKFVGSIEVIFNGTLASSRYKNHVPHTRRIGFFYGVLNERLVDHRQHLFGRCFGGRQKSCSQSSHWKDGFANAGLAAHGLAFIQFNVVRKYHVRLTMVFQDLVGVDSNWPS